MNNSTIPGHVKITYTKFNRILIRQNALLQSRKLKSKTSSCSFTRSIRHASTSQRDAYYYVDSQSVHAILRVVLLIVELVKINLKIHERPIQCFQFVWKMASHSYFILRKQNDYDCVSDREIDGAIAICDFSANQLFPCEIFRNSKVVKTQDFF